MIFRTLTILFALCLTVRAQNIKTVMADTNGTIHGNAALEARIAGGGDPTSYVKTLNGASTNQTLVSATVSGILSFTLAEAGVLDAGQMSWDTDWLTFKFGLGNGVQGQAFQEGHILAKNVWTNTIPNGWAVMHSGAVGNSGKFEIVPAIATVGMRRGAVLGILTEDVAVGALGRITKFGNVNAIGSDGSLYGASGWLDNTPVYLSHTHAGWLVTNAPPAPYSTIQMGNIINAHSSGAVYVDVRCGMSLKDLDDVDGTPLTLSGQIPVWDQSRSVFDFTANVYDFVTEAALADYSATNRIKRLHDSQSTRYYQTVENGTGTVWVITGPFTNLTITLSSDFRDAIDLVRPAWTNSAFPFTDGLWEGVYNDGAPYYRIIYNGGSSLWLANDSALPATLIAAQEAEGSATVAVSNIYYTTNIYSTFATEATVSNVNANLQACYVSNSNQIEALPASLQPYTLTVYGDLATTNTAGYADFISTNGAAKSIQISSPTFGLKLAQFRYNITNAEAAAHGSVDWSSWVQVAAGSSNSITFVRLLAYSAEGTLIASNDGARVVSSPASYSNLTASVTLPSAVTNGYILTEIYSATNTARTSVIHTGGSYPTTLSFQASPLGYLTPAEAAATYTTPEAVTNIVLDSQQVFATMYGYGSVTSTVPGAFRLTNSLPLTPLATITNLNTTNGAYVAKFVTGTGLRFTRISQGLLDVHMHHRKGAAGQCTLRPEFYLLDADGNKIVEFDAAQTSDPLTIDLGDSTIAIPIPSNLVVTASNRIGIYLKAIVSVGTPNVYIDCEDNVNFIVSVPIPSAEFVTQGQLDTKADKSTSLTINGVTGNLSSNNVWSSTLPTNGCTELSGVTPEITGATYAYFLNASTAEGYALSIAANAPRYHYSLEIVGVEGWSYTLPANMRLRGEWTATGTNAVVIVPSTGTLWNVYGRGL